MKGAAERTAALFLYLVHDGSIYYVLYNNVGILNYYNNIVAYFSLQAAYPTGCSHPYFLIISSSYNLFSMS